MCLQTSFITVYASDFWLSSRYSKHKVTLANTIYNYLSQIQCPAHRNLCLSTSKIKLNNLSY